MTTSEDFITPRARKWSLPRAGFMRQGAQASGTELNSSIGVALKDDGRPLVLPSLTDLNGVDDTALLYSNCSGEPALRRKWAELKGQNTLPLVTAGLTNGLNLAAHLFLGPGDTIHIPSPVYENYNHMLEDYFEAKIESFPLTSPTASLNLEGIQSVLDKEGDMVRFLFNFPQNPTGYSPTKEDVKKLLPLLKSAAAKGKRILIILDDAYHGLNHGDDIYPHSLFTPLSDLDENILACKVDGATKEYYSWGLRIGFISFARRGMTENEYALLEDKTASLIRASLSNISRLAQEMLLKALENPAVMKEQQENVALISRRYARIRAELAAHPEYAERYVPLPYNSGYFLCVRLASDRDAETVRNKLREEYSTGVMVPAPGLIRLAYSSLGEEKIPKLLENLYKACGE